MKRLSGVVTSGAGKARGFTQLAWLRAQFRDKFGFDPYPGTLNVRVDPGEAMPTAFPSVLIEPGEAGCCPARAAWVWLNGRVRAIWIMPDVPGYPADQVELMAEQSLRTALGLRDGDGVVIEIQDGAL